MHEAVICSPLRTATGAFRGSLKGVPAQDLAALVIQELLKRTGVPGDAVEDVILGHGYPTMEAPAIGRVAALNAGLPVSVPGTQIDRRCGSALQAVIDGALRIQTGAQSLVVAGGAESMSNAPHYTLDLRNTSAMGGLALHDSLVRGRVTAGGTHYPLPGGTIEMAENMRRAYSISRREQDEYALQSHQRAAAAAAAGKFDSEIVPVPITTKQGTTEFVLDQHVRPDASMESLSGLRPIRSAEDHEATVTAGNASGQNDGAAACIVTSAERAAELGLEPVLVLRSWATVGVEPAMLGTGPVEASAKALAAAGLTLDDMDLIEVNEAFASQVIACCREWQIDPFDDERLNVNGSGISLGHPIGATGARILATMANEMTRRNGRYCLETMCIGGGMGLAAVFERTP